MEAIRSRPGHLERDGDCGPQCARVSYSDLTGTEMVIWGGETNTTVYRNNGARYIQYRIRGLRHLTPDAGWPNSHTAIWTGHEILSGAVWLVVVQCNSEVATTSSGSLESTALLGAPGARICTPLSGADVK